MSINYKICESPFEQDLTDNIAEACKRILGDLNLENFYWNLENRHHVTMAVAFHEGHLVGFKIGYSKGKEKYYSWLGGVDEKWRRKGIAIELMKIQHDWCRSKNYKLIETQTLNKWKEMLIFNLKSGFNLVGVCESKKYGLRLILERELES